MEPRKELSKKLQPKNISMLFKETMWKTYCHSSFPKKNTAPKVKDKKGDHEKLRNLTHFTVHEFNEALYFALREFSSYVNFA